jgi:putative spermidine/putrescine transport system substrate-binding protein
MTLRTMKAALIALAAACSVLLAAPDDSHATSQGKQRELVVVSYGGAYQSAQRKAFFNPFEKKYHVRIREESWNGDLAKLKAMVQSGDVTWDVAVVEDYMVPLGGAENLYEKIDYSKVPRAALLPAATNAYGVASCFWSTVLAYNTNSFPGSTHPSGWKQFWNVKAFPGARSLRDDPAGNLEIALLAAGVPKDKLYPLDVDGAFRSLDKSKPSIKVWWKAGKQPAQFLASGKVKIASAWSGRIFNAIGAGKPEAIDWNGGIVSSDWWVIPRGAKHKDLAQKFIAFASSAGPQADLPKYMPYGPVNKKAIALIPPHILKNLPTAPDNAAKEVFKNAAWWSKHQAEVLKRWNLWLRQ